MQVKDFWDKATSRQRKAILTICEIACVGAYSKLEWIMLPSEIINILKHNWEIQQWNA